MTGVIIKKSKLQIKNSKLFIYACNTCPIAINMLTVNFNDKLCCIKKYKENVLQEIPIIITELNSVLVTILLFFIIHLLIDSFNLNRFTVKLELKNKREVELYNFMLSKMYNYCVRLKKYFIRNCKLMTFIQIKKELLNIIDKHKSNMIDDIYIELYYFDKVGVQHSLDGPYLYDLLIQHSQIQSNNQINLQWEISYYPQLYVCLMQEKR